MAVDGTPNLSIARRTFYHWAIAVPCKMLFKLKHYTNISVLKSVYFLPFHSYLTYSILNWERASKTTLLPLIRLQNKAVRILEYTITETAVLYSKYKILEIPDLFKLSVTEFRYFFYSGGLPNHFENNQFAEIASVHICKYQTRLASLQKYYLPRMKAYLSQLSLSYIGPKMWSNITENLKASSPYSFGKKYKNVLPGQYPRGRNPLQHFSPLLEKCVGHS